MHQQLLRSLSNLALRSASCNQIASADEAFTWLPTNFKMDLSDPTGGVSGVQVSSRASRLALCPSAP